MPIILQPVVLAPAAAASGEATLLYLIQSVAGNLGYAQGQASASGRTDTLVDISLGTPFAAQDDRLLMKSAWVMIERDVASTPRNVGEVRRVTEYDGEQVTLARGFSYPIADTMAYGIYAGVPPFRSGIVKGIAEYINETLQANYYRTHVTAYTNGTAANVEYAPLPTNIVEVEDADINGVSVSFLERYGRTLRVVPSVGAAEVLGVKALVTYPRLNLLADVTEAPIPLVVAGTLWRIYRDTADPRVAQALAAYSQARRSLPRATQRSMERL